MQIPFLEITDLKVSVEGKQIINGVSLKIGKGEVAALMGPNGAGKSSLGYALMGHPKYKVDSGSIMLGGEDISGLSPTDRAKRGLFLSFQYPSEIPGVTVESFLRAAYKSVRPEMKDIGVLDFHRLLLDKMSKLHISEQFSSRHLNEGFSGGEKKRMEILQFSVLEPQMAVLDETDSGLDIDSLKIVASGINRMVGPDIGILLITHYQRILNFIKPDTVHVMMSGKIVASGESTLAAEIEEKGYDWLKEK